MCNTVSGMVHLKESLLLIGKSSSCGGSGFPLSLWEWLFAICTTLYSRKYNALIALLNKTLLLQYFVCFHFMRLELNAFSNVCISL